MVGTIAYAKINLALHVRQRRSDGYHDLETVFAFLEDGDAIDVGFSDALSLTIDGPFADGLSTTDNLVLQAATALGPGRGAAIRLTKNLPVSSGIGGGSADAAAALRLLSQFWNLSTDLSAIAEKLGADVPACVTSTTVRGVGRGDHLIVCGLDLAGTAVLLVNPMVPLSTATVFAAWDGVDRGALGDWQTGRNDLEPAARTLVPAIGALVEWLGAQQGVTVARMSGSGATCFALFTTIEARDAVADAITTRFPGYWTMRSALR